MFSFTLHICWVQWYLHHVNTTSMFLIILIRGGGNTWLNWAQFISSTKCISHQSVWMSSQLNLIGMDDKITMILISWYSASLNLADVTWAWQDITNRLQPLLILDEVRCHLNHWISRMPKWMLLVEVGVFPYYCDKQEGCQVFITNALSGPDFIVMVELLSQVLWVHSFTKSVIESSIFLTIYLTLNITG